MTGLHKVKAPQIKSPFMYRSSSCCMLVDASRDGKYRRQNLMTGKKHPEIKSCRTTEEQTARSSECQRGTGDESSCENGKPGAIASREASQRKVRMDR